MADAEWVVPSILRVEAAELSICSVRPLTVPASSSMPPLALMTPEPLLSGTFSIPHPLSPVADPSVPRPLTLPPARVRPLPSLSVEPAPSSFTALLPIAMELMATRLAVDPSSSVPLDPAKPSENAALDAPVSSKVSPAVPPTLLIDRKRLDDRLSTPPDAAMEPEPLIAPDTVPQPHRLAPLSTLSPEAALSVPPDRRTTPLLTLSSALMVRLPP